MSSLMYTARMKRVGLRLVLVSTPMAFGWLVACSTGDPSSPENAELLDGSTTSPSGKGLSDSSSIVDVLTPSQDSGNDGDAHDAGVDSDSDADAAPPLLEKVVGSVDFNGPMKGVTVELLSPTTDSLVTDETGTFFFFAPQGSTAVIKATPPSDAGAYPMIRGVVVEKAARVRIFYLQAKSDLDVLTSLGVTQDDSKAIVEVDFRSAQVGGFGVTMKSGMTVVSPGYGLAYDADGKAVKSLVTITGGDGTTLLLGNVAPSSVGFTAIVPQDAGLPCVPCDAPVLPLQSGVVTWFDFECGTANCH